jgi:hypothetical protein
LSGREAERVDLLDPFQAVDLIQQYSGSLVLEDLPLGSCSDDQYSDGNKAVVAERSASVISHIPSGP